MIALIRTLIAVVTLVVAAAVPPATLQAQPPQQQSEFVPIDQLPPQDQLPAARLLIGAYSFVMIVLSVYLFSVARRLSAIQREVDRLESDLKRGGRT